MNNRTTYAAVIATTAMAFGLMDVAHVRAEESFYQTALSKAANDAALKGRVEAALAVERTLSEQQVYVDAKGGVILLSGEVADTGQRSMAGRVAASVEGVEKVMNELIVPRQI